jgi:fatty acid desaturase
MGPVAYQGLRQSLREEGAFRLSNLRGLLTVLFEAAVLSLGVGYLVYGAAPFGAGYWVAEVLLGTSLYRMFVLLHECGHGTLFRGRTANTIVGTLISPFCLMPYFPWRSIHFLHHKWVGVIDKDPTQAHLLKLSSLSSGGRLLFRILWKCFLPIPYITYIIDVFWGQPFRQLRRGEHAAAGRGFFSLLCCTAPHAALLASLGPARYATLFGPMLLLYFVIFEMVNLPQHAGIFPHLSTEHPASIPPHAQDEITRTARLPGIVGVLLCYNFNLHTEHHLFPTIPWYRLPAVSQKVDGHDDVLYQNVSMMCFAIESRLEDPIDFFVNSLPDGAAGHLMEPV